MKLALHGASGRMGLTIAKIVAEADDIQLVGAVCGADDSALGKDIGELAGVGTLGVECSADAGSALLGADVVIDFSVAGAVAPLLNIAARQKIAVVCGTTNLDDKGKQALDAAAKAVPVLWAPNMSLGVQVLAELLEQALQRLGPSFDAEIVEIHHRRKVDSPSGTATRLGDVVRKVRPETRELRGRDGDVGARTDEEMAIFGVRGGDVIGDHTVYLLGPSERIELTHRATDRGLFAQGAVRAARFLAGKAAGSYTISDVVNG
ncbi:MAG: 4-hydroxy-tetrahydrodipicolinate reductase [Myxococcales bacterium]|nr:4-hydroxy-tetrahydrodipicolinate reductase [Myxococcales bacterium]